MKSRIGKRGAVLVAAVVVAAAVLAGSALAGHAATKTTTLNAKEVDYKITLSKAIVVPGSYKFVVHNSGTVAHKFGVKGNGISRSVAGLIQPGQTKTLIVSLKKGTYTVFCALHSGMSRRLTVKPAGM